MAGKRYTRLLLEEEKQLRGSSVVPMQQKRRNLQVTTHPRHASVDRSVKVTRPDGTVHYLSRTMGNRSSRHANVTVVPDRPHTRNLRYAGAEHGETWQTKHSVHTETKEAHVWEWRGHRFDSFEAMAAFIDSTA